MNIMFWGDLCSTV